MVLLRRSLADLFLPKDTSLGIRLIEVFGYLWRDANLLSKGWIVRRSCHRTGLLCRLAWHGLLLLSYNGPGSAIAKSQHWIPPTTSNRCAPCYCSAVNYRSNRASIGHRRCWQGGKSHWIERSQTTELNHTK